VDRIGKNEKRITNDMKNNLFMRQIYGD